LNYLTSGGLFLPGIIYRCETCTVLFKQAEFNVSAIYNRDYATRALATARSQSNDLNNFVSERIGTGANNRLLDIGAGTGSFVKKIKEKGWAAEGLEVNETFSDFAKQDGLIFFCQAIDDFKGWSNYTHFTMLDVIEHLPDPVAVLKLINQSTPPDATLWILTPNHQSVLVSLGLWLYNIGIKSIGEEIFGCTHMFFFTPSTLETTLRTGGWQMKKRFWRSYRSTDVGGGAAGILHYIAQLADIVGGFCGFGKYRLLVEAKKMQ
jgi:2-polyprenyl-3-methyl-5-hydroxy-6-metoxy-1,4-benzoquinol methylase